MDCSSNNAWSRKGRIIGAAGLRSYMVQKGRHHMLRHNRHHLLCTSKVYCPKSSDDKFRALSTPLPTAMTPCIAPTDSAQQAIMLPCHGPSPVIQAEVPSVPTATVHACTMNPALRRSRRSVEPLRHLGYDASLQQIV